ncbi:hypothetical protein FB451DRAFT_750840 [Mycena latifolia]|nr:hypothetical protein FB451DRAFT_750840 [Mycena latifolia]
MTDVVGLLRGYYVPQFVLGGLTRAIGPVIFRYAATSARHVFFKQQVTTSTSHSHAEVPADTSLLTEGSYVQILAPISALTSVYLPFSVIQAICLLDEVPPPMSTPTSFDVQHPASTIPALTSAYILFSVIQAICLFEQDEVSPPISSPILFDIPHTTSSIPAFTSVNTPFSVIQAICHLDQMPQLMSSPTWFAIQYPVETTSAPTSAYLPFSGIQSICPLHHHEVPPTPSAVVQASTQHPDFTTKVSATFPFLAMQAMCPLYLVQLDPNATLAPAPALSVFPSSVTISQTIGSYLFSPLVLFQLLVVCLISVIIADMDWWRSERLAKNNLPSALVQPAHNKLRRKPSDAPNWRVPRNNALQTEIIQSPPAAARLETPSITSQPEIDYLPPNGVPAHRQAALPADLPATPKCAPYVPPHRRASFDFGSRRPLAEVGNAFSNGRGETAPSSNPPSQTDPKLRRRSSAQFVQSPAQKLHHRASFPDLDGTDASMHHRVLTTTKDGKDRPAPGNQSYGTPLYLD